MVKQENCSGLNLWKETKQGKAQNSKWFVGGKTNLSYNCLDKHLTTEKRNKAAIIWESESGESKILTYQLLFSQVCKFANLLKKIGVQSRRSMLSFIWE